MNIPQAQLISHELADYLISDSLAKGFSLSFDSRKHQVVVEDNQDWLAKIYLPWTVQWSESIGLLENSDSHFSLVLIRAGQAVVGYFHQGVLLDHKVFRAYMVRQKQGKSQIKYLKTKGKSRSGSRIRLAETTQFFEEINDRLGSYAAQFPIDLWGISCAKTLWPYYFSSAVTPPFTSKADNLIELPFHVSQGSFEELKIAGELLQKYQLILSEKGKNLISVFPESDFDPTQKADW
ncbi:hypothetical protein [Algoriphagus boritolerans]|uniref:VLRF1 domain-containing protein n=2 Tax=Algoriphagus TaxID=246875 RepID=A0A1H5XLY1_9BACT|nr:hypothetical protein [Algoriphagus boritolerans]SEG12643.1 hypothetical protein SAMN03080598_02566 [Algoriphagus boritolerans DSM 17298 = JCM 18970]